MLSYLREEPNSVDPATKTYGFKRVHDSSRATNLCISGYTCNISRKARLNCTNLNYVVNATTFCLNVRYMLLGRAVHPTGALITYELKCFLMPLRIALVVDNQVRTERLCEFTLLV